VQRNTSTEHPQVQNVRTERSRKCLEQPPRTAHLAQREVTLMRVADLCGVARGGAILYQGNLALRVNSLPV
jgi:hypothetical protein